MTRTLSLLSLAVAVGCQEADTGTDTSTPEADCAIVVIDTYEPWEVVEGVEARDGMPMVRRCRNEDVGERCESVAWVMQDGTLHAYALEVEDGWVEVWWVLHPGVMPL